MNPETEQQGYIKLLAALEEGDSRLILRAYRELWDQKEKLEAEIGDLKIERDRYRECLKRVHGLLILEPTTGSGPTCYTAPHDLKRLIGVTMGIDN